MQRKVHGPVAWAAAWTAAYCMWRWVVDVSEEARVTLKP